MSDQLAQFAAYTGDKNGLVHAIRALENYINQYPTSVLIEMLNEKASPVETDGYTPCTWYVDVAGGYAEVIYCDKNKALHRAFGGALRPRDSPLGILLYPIPQHIFASLMDEDLMTLTVDSYP